MSIGFEKGVAALDIISLIKDKYGDTYRLRSPLTKEEYNQAKELLPKELLDVLKVSNGIDEIMMINGKAETIWFIIDPLSRIIDQTSFYHNEYGNDGIVFAGNGAGGFYILKDNGKIYLFEYFDIGEELYAESLAEYFKKM